MATVALIVLTATCDETNVNKAPASASQRDPFKAGTGWFSHYVREAIWPETARLKYPATPFRAITARIEDGFYTDRGVSNVMVYAPYRASAEFRGLPARRLVRARPVPVGGRGPVWNLS